MEHGKSTWVIVGICLWGIPTASLLALMNAFRKPETWVEIQPFQLSVFLNTLAYAVPVCCFFGVMIGLLIYKLGENYRR